MKTNTSSKIVEYISSKGQATGKELADYLEISDRAVWFQINKLLEKGLIKKIGKSPKVFYVLKEHKDKKETYLNNETEKIIEKEFLMVTPAGEEKFGVEGFIYWCEKQKLPIEKTAKEYLTILDKYSAYFKEGLIDGMSKIKSTFKEVYLDNLFYIDFYSIERFGKTKLGQMLLYAKQSQNKNYIKRLVQIIEPKIKQVIKKYRINCVGFVLPTVKREVQIMVELERTLQIQVGKLNLVKVKTPVIVPQKTLNKLEYRIENAQSTFVVDDDSVYKNILLIDDAVGSGATLNEIARKIRIRKICKGKIIGLAITGSFKGFDVISEV